MKQVNTINTELIDMYLSEIEACRKRLKEAKDIYDKKDSMVGAYRSSLHVQGIRFRNDQKFLNMLSELNGLNLVTEKRQTQLDAVCSELEKAVKLKTLEAIAINYHILQNTPVHYKKFTDTVNVAIDNKWSFNAYIDSFGYPVMYIFMQQVNFTDSHIYMRLNDRKIDWENTACYRCLLSVDEIYKEVAEYYKYKENLNQAFKNVRQMYEDMATSLKNNYLKRGIYDVYYKKAR